MQIVVFHAISPPCKKGQDKLLGQPCSLGFYLYHCCWEICKKACRCSPHGNKQAKFVSDFRGLDKALGAVSPLNSALHVEYPKFPLCFLFKDRLFETPAFQPALQQQPCPDSPAFPAYGRFSGDAHWPNKVFSAIPGPRALV